MLCDKTMEGILALDKFKPLTEPDLNKLHIHHFNFANDKTYQMQIADSCPTCKLLCPYSLLLGVAVTL